MIIIILSNLTNTWHMVFLNAIVAKHKTKKNGDVIKLKNCRVK